MLSRRLLEELRAYWKAGRPETWLFPGDIPGLPITRDAVGQVCSKARLASGISKPITPHFLRHAFATPRAKAAPLSAVGDQLVVPAVTAHAQEAVGQDAAVEKGVELRLAGRAGPAARLLARHKQSPGLFVSGLGPHKLQQVGASWA